MPNHENIDCLPDSVDYAPTHDINKKYECQKASIYHNLLKIHDVPKKELT